MGGSFSRQRTVRHRRVATGRQNTRTHTHTEAQQKEGEATAHGFAEPPPPPPPPLPVLCAAQDGSCNGLQHYAALGRDAKGARAVNIADVDRPQDVYSGIAELVAEQVEKDAAAGVLSAKLLLNNVDRKLVKQTVCPPPPPPLFTSPLCCPPVDPNCVQFTLPRSPAVHHCIDPSLFHETAAWP